MSYSAKILADSLAPSGVRLTTFELTYPRFVHAELMTHRQFSRNAASSRAIPIEKMIERVEKDPAIPRYWGKNRPGMKATEELSGTWAKIAYETWLDGAKSAVRTAKLLYGTGLHKEVVNRVLEPFSWITVIVTATDYDNFFNQRVHPDAQPEIRWVAESMQLLLKNSIPKNVAAGEWHMPLVHNYEKESYPPETLRKVSVARAARVSYLTHEGKCDIKKDLELYDKLVNASPPHLSPFEHVAMALLTKERSGNLVGWKQLRKVIEK